MKVFKILLIFLIIIVLITMVCFIGLILTNKINFLSVLSSSMSPVIEQGDMVITIPIKISNIKLGDIITYNQEDKLITHRVEQVYENYGKTLFITKGDANKFQDINPVKKEQIVGLYLTKIPRNLCYIAKSKWSIFLILISLLIIRILTNKKS